MTVGNSELGYTGGGGGLDAVTAPAARPRARSAGPTWSAWPPSPAGSGPRWRRSSRASPRWSSWPSRCCWPRAIEPWSGHRGQARGRPARAHRAAGRGPPADRGRARRRQDHAGQGAGQVHRLHGAAHPVHPGPAALGHHRGVDLRPAAQGVRVQARRDLRQHRGRRRDQPRLAQDPVGAAGVHGGAAGDRRRHHLPPGGAVHGGGHPEPDRDGGHLPAARGPARPVHGPHLDGLPGAGRRAADAGHPRPGLAAGGPAPGDRRARGGPG